MRLTSRDAGFEVGVFKRHYMEAGRFGALNDAIFIQRQHNGRDFEQRIGRRVESAGFDIDDDGQKSPETVGDRDRAGHVPITLTAVT